MLNYTLRRLFNAVPTLLIIALAIFLLLDLAPGDPMAQVPLTISPEVKEQMRATLGLDGPTHIRFLKWMRQILFVEPMALWDGLFGTVHAADMQRVVSWQTRSPVMEIIGQRLPQTLWVVGTAYLLGSLVALPVGLYSAYRRYSIFDQLTTIVAMVGYSVPTFVIATVLILVFSVNLGWFPMIYDTTHQVTSWSSFIFQIKQIALPVLVVSLQIMALLSRYMRNATLDNLEAEFIRTARAKGVSEPKVLMSHVLRASMIPVVAVIALGLPQVFGGALVTETIFGVNGIGQLLVLSIKAGDMPVVLTVTFLLAVLIVMFNIAADLVYGWLDPRVRYE